MTKETDNKDTNATFRDLPGIIIEAPHGNRLVNAETSLVVKSVPFKIKGKEFYVIQGDEVLGIVKFDSKREIEIEDFRKLEEGHGISEAEAKEWWPETDVFWVYGVSAINKFQSPIKITRPKNAEIFVKNVKFILEDKSLTEVINSGEKTKPKIKPNDFLKILGGLPVQNEGDRSPKIQKDAITSRQSGIVPFRYFDMLTGDTVPKMQELIVAINPRDYPLAIERKIDGIRLQIHKKDNKARIISATGEELTDKLPAIVTEALELSDCVLDAILTGCQDYFYANVLDIVWKGNDVHNASLEERKELLQNMKKTDHIKIIEMKIIKNKDELEAATKWATGLEDSKGAEVKSLKSKYPLTGHTSRWHSLETIKTNHDALGVGRAMPQGGKFSLSHLGWADGTLQAPEWFRQEWHMFLEDTGKVIDFIMDQDPKGSQQVPMIIGESKPISLLKTNGKVRPGTKLNPSKRAPAHLTILESGNFKIISEEKNRIVLTLKGTGLRGKYQLERGAKGPSLWVFSKHN